jgi:hypothetical protein
MGRLRGVKAERLKRVEILTSRANPGKVTISWNAREDLLERLGPGPDTFGLVASFRNVGASSPVRLTIEEKQQLSIMVESWLEEVGDYNLLPTGIWDLRNALIDDLHDAGLGP